MPQPHQSLPVRPGNPQQRHPRAHSLPSRNFSLGYIFYTPGATQHHRPGGTPKIQQDRNPPSDKRGRKQTTTLHGIHGERGHGSTAPPTFPRINNSGEEADNDSEEEDEVEEEDKVEEADNQQSNESEEEDDVEEEDDQQSNESEEEDEVEEEEDVIMAAAQPQVSGGQLSSILPYSGNPGLEGLAFIEAVDGPRTNSHGRRCKPLRPPYLAEATQWLIGLEVKKQQV